MHQTHTTLAALHGIVESGEIWASSAALLNDKSEYAFGMSVLAKVVARETSIRRKEHQAAAAYTNELLESLVDEREVQEVLENLFLVSASADGDSLSQWVHYAGTGGVAIALSDSVWLYAPAQLERLATGVTGEREDSASWFPLVYGERVVEANLSATLRDSIGDGLVDEPLDVNEQAQLKLVRVFMRQTLLEAKHPAFSAEVEWRYVVIPGVDERPSFRPSESSLVPYMPLRAKPEAADGRQRLPITRVRVGPTSPPQAERTLRSYLAARGLEDVQVERSTIPYRSAAGS